jgi:hypothetical protein
MARKLNHGAVEVGVRPTLICTAMQDVSTVMVQNVSNVPVFVGSEDVTIDGARRGLRVKPDETQTIWSYQNDANTIWGVIAGDGDATATVVFLMSH